MAGPLTLAIDVGASGTKAVVLDEAGAMVHERVRVKTPRRVTPEQLIEVITILVQPLPAYDRVSVGFPGVVRDGKILTAANLGRESWRGFDLASALAERLDKPVRVMNDADVQGLGAIAGRGVEMIITLGTGFGCGLYQDGRLAPHLELGHHPFRRGQTYEEQLGQRALKKVGKKRWNRRLRRAVATLRELVNFDRLYIGGGNARLIDFEPDPDVTIVANRAGLLGGIALWRDEAPDTRRSL